MFENLLGKKPAAQGAVVSIDPLCEAIRFCTMNREQSALLTDCIAYRPQKFDQAFYNQLAAAIAKQLENNPAAALEQTSLILPDQLFLLDLINVPMIHRKAMQHSLSLAVEAVYKNAEDLNLVTYPVQQTKQAATFGLAGTRRDLLEQLRQIFSDNGITVTGITFASNAMVNGAFVLNPKLKDETFLLVDIKESCARFAFVVRGCTMGYFDLPFGYKILHGDRLVAEDNLFDHRAAELLVLNAKERAKAKNLTVAGWGETADTEEADEDTVRKGGRRLPKYMQRPLPETDAGYMYENFRIFIKWALELIAGNPSIVSLAKLDKVYVNIPADYAFLLDMANEERSENGVDFLPLLTDSGNFAFGDDLELYGGFFLGQYNEANTF